MDLGLSQPRVAERLGVAPETVLHWELNQTQPGVRHVRAVSEFLEYFPIPASANLPDQLVATRRRLGLTQRGLALRLRVDPSTILRWEHGKGRPPPTLGCRLQQLVQEDRERRASS
jgi:transcriptional regulator with XRE-family HTH domain